MARNGDGRSFSTETPYQMHPLHNELHPEKASARPLQGSSAWQVSGKLLDLVQVWNQGPQIMTSRARALSQGGEMGGVCGCRYLCPVSPMGAAWVSP